MAHEFDEEDVFFSMDEDDEIIDEMTHLLFQLEETMRTLPKKQVSHHPNQVIRRCELKKGKHYIEVTCGTEKEIELTSDPFLEEGKEFSYIPIPSLEEEVVSGKWKVRLKSIKSGIEGEEYLCDIGIMPYENGGWNPSNYLRFIE